MEVLVTGGAGFVGSHAAEFFARAGNRVTVVDNLSRARSLPTALRGRSAVLHNWRHLRNVEGVELVRGDVRNARLMERLAGRADAIVHCAAQVAVTTSLTDPAPDFTTNAAGTFQILEGARKGGKRPALIFTSTNKVYGDNVNRIRVVKAGRRYRFGEQLYAHGLAEDFPIDHCEHTPYGCSKLAADLYVQDYSRRGIVDGVVFRMSCIYGTRQFGNEDQGWVAHFAIATLAGRPLTIFGDGMQVRDVLFVDDLVAAFDAAVRRRDRCAGGVFNMGGGPEKTLSLLELMDTLHGLTGKRSPLKYDSWRAGDQKVYISDTRKARRILGWNARVAPEEGVARLVEWVRPLRALHAH